MGIDGQRAIKLAKPSLSAVAPRERVFRLLEEACRSSIVWVSAPAGAGKTTAVASYLDYKGLASLWYQIDASDNDLASFFYHMGLAVHDEASGRREALPLFTCEYSSGLPAFTTNYFRQLFARLTHPCVLVFDDYHELANQESDDNAFHHALQLGLLQAPVGTTVVFMSRLDPPPAFARLQTTGQMAHLGWDAIKLCESESAAIMQLRWPRALPESVMQRLHRDTQGWVTGLVLMVEQMGSKQSVDDAFEDQVGAVMSAPGSQILFDYFAYELFRRLKIAEQQFLLQTALLPNVRVEVAQQLTRNENSEVLLRNLARQNYFTVIREDGSFEYHPLFRAFLVNLGTETYTFEQLRDLQQRGAALLSALGDVENAVELLLKSRDWEGSLKLILAHASKLAKQGRTQTLSRWLGKLPAPIRDPNPWVLYWLGMCDLAYSPNAARKWLERAFEIFEKGDVATPVLLAWSAIVDSFVMEWRDFSELGPWLDRYAGLTGSRHGANPEVVDASVFSYVTGLLWGRPNDPDLPLYAERAESIYNRQTDMQRRFSIAVTHLLTYHFYAGSLEKFKAIHVAIAQYPLIATAKPLVRLNWLLSKAILEVMTGVRDKTLDAVTEGLALAKTSGVHMHDVHLCGYGIWRHLCCGNVSEARILLERMPMSFEGGQQEAYHRFNTALVLLHEGHVRRAINEASLALDASQTGARTIVMSCLLSLSSALCAAGQVDAARQRLDEARELAREIRSDLFSAICDFVSAHIERLLGNRERAFESLGRFLSFSNDTGLITPAYIARTDAAAVLALALEHGFRTEEVSRFIVTAGLSPPRGIVSDRWPWPIRIYSLGAFAVMMNSKPLTFTGKAQKKSLELLKVLVAFGGRDVTVHRVTQELWPDTDIDTAKATLKSTLFRLRRLIGDEAILLNESSLTINPAHCWLDTWVLERVASGLPDEQVEDEKENENAERLLRLYRGPLLPDDDEPWVMPQRERARSQFLQSISNLAQRAERSHRYAMLVRLYQRAIEEEPLAEDFYQRLMRCHASAGQVAEARAVYRLCKDVLAAALDMEPNSETEALLQELDSTTAKRDLVDRVST